MLIDRFNKLKFSLPLILVALLVSGCGQSLYMQGRKLSEKGQYTSATEKFGARVLERPDDHQAWRELGVARYQLGDNAAALEALNNANSLKPEARTLFFIGLTHEKLKQWDNAGEAYSSALQLESSEKIANRVASRLDLLATRSEIESALATEASIDAESIPKNTIAVYDFDGSSLGPELAPLALGLAEFTAIDLSKIKSLTVVERSKLHLLIKEMQLTETGYVDPARAPKLGRILGSRNIVTASVTSPQAQHLRLSGIIVNTVDSSEAFPESAESILHKIFEMQKEFVRRIVIELGIELTPEEQDSLDVIPTDSYEAFLAYCYGLLYQRNGQFERASSEFRRAVNLDEGFSGAQEQLELTTVLSNEADFENFIQTQTIGGLTDLESTLGSVVENTGAITPPEGGGGDESSQQPPVIPTGSVRVKGKLGGK